MLACRKSRLRSLLGADGKPEPLIRARRAPIERMLHCLFAGAPPTFVTLRLKQDRPGSLTEPEVRSRSRSPSNPTRLPRLACSPTLAALDRIRGLVCACRSIAWSTSSGAPVRCLLSVCGCHAGATPLRSLTYQLAPLLHRDQCDALPYPRPSSIACARTGSPLSSCSSCVRLVRCWQWRCPSDANGVL